MNTIKYYTLGSRSEKEGLTLMTAVFNKDGEPVANYPLDKMYKLQEITEKEYNVLYEELKNPSIGRLGIAGGLINEEGLKEIEEMNIAILAASKADSEARAVKFFQRAKKMEELGISTLEDEISLFLPSRQVATMVDGFEELESLTDEDAASVWAVLNASEEELISGGQVPEGATLASGKKIRAGNFGNIQSKARKVEVMTWFNLSDEFNSKMTNPDYASKIIKDRERLFFTGKK